MIAEALALTFAQVQSACSSHARKEQASVYYFSPYYYCAVKNEEYLPPKLYSDDAHKTEWEKVCFKQGRTLYRTLDGNAAPPIEPLDCTNSSFEWFIGPLSNLPDANTLQK